MATASTEDRVEFEVPGEGTVILTVEAHAETHESATDLASSVSDAVTREMNV